MERIGPSAQLNRSIVFLVFFFVTLLSAEKSSLLTGRRLQINSIGQLEAVAGVTQKKPEPNWWNQ